MILILILILSCMYLRIEVPVVGFSALRNSEKAGPVWGGFFNKVLYSTDPHLGLVEIYEMLKCEIWSSAADEATKRKILCRADDRA